ncbi:hypothetical protein [Sulfurovum sp.]|uniref:hypothetical protein n=1 Tax=Sulfurovum sp. TaxID=1969726 RepID=UPI0025F24024|nr:hypothetical protein [Sulfurovum sp.]
MHTIKLKVQDGIYEHIMFFLKNLNSRQLQILEDTVTPKENDDTIKVFSEHTANLIEDWQDPEEDYVWK